VPSRIERLFASSLTITAVRLAGAGAGFAAQMVMARSFGAPALGLFYAVTSLVTVVAMLALQGYPAVATRFLARYREREGLAVAFVGAAARHAALGTAIAAAGLVAVALAWPFESAQARAGLLIGAACLPFLAMIGHSAAIAAANRRFDIAYVPDALARPAMLLAGVAALAASGLPTTGAVAIGLFAAVAAGVALVQTPLAARLVPRVAPARVAPRQSRRWRREAWGAAIVALFVGAFADVAIVLAAPLMPKAEVAVFGLCLKLSFLVGFLVQAAHHVAAPDLADARRTGDGARLRAALRKAVVIPVAVTLAATLGALALGGPVLGLFGPDFGAGEGVLVLLLAAQAVRAAAGPSVTMLTLAGAQGENAALCVMALVVLAVASLALASAFGALGAAAAVALATLAWHIGVAAVLRRRGEPGTDLLTLAREAARRRAEAAA
jgi:O-antigen/teichoic acid export membrane protein